MTDQEFWAELATRADELFSWGDNGVIIWRRFLCASYRRVEELIPTSTGRQLVEMAEQFIVGGVGRDDLTQAYREAERVTDEAWQEVVRLKLPDSWSWPLSDDVDAAWVRYVACEAAKAAVQPELRPTIIPDTAAGVRAWALARRNLRDRGKDVDSVAARDAVQQEWDRLNAVEQEAQLQILMGLVRDGQVSEGRPAG